MSKNIATIILGLYFFCYTIPQNIPKLYVVYDRVTIQILFLSILNLVTFIILSRKNYLIGIISKLDRRYHVYSFLIFITVCFISLFVADNLAEGLVTLTKYFTYFCSFILIICLTHLIKKRFLNTILIFAILAVFIESVWINYLFYDSVITNGNFLSRNNDFRGFTGNINISSFSIALKIPVLFYIIFKSEYKILRFISYALIFSAFLSILLLLSRGAILSIIFVTISIIIMLALNQKKHMIRRFIYSSFFIILSFVAYGLLNDKNPSDIIIDRFSTVSSPIEDDSVNERLNFYSTAFNSISKTPLLGVGIGNWKVISIFLSRDVIAEYRVPYFVHNDFLQVFAEVGVVGFISYLYFIFFPFIVSLKKSFFERDFTLYFLVFLILGVFIIDSLLNFPMDRPVNFIFFLFTIALFYLIPKINFDHEK